MSPRDGVPERTASISFVVALVVMALSGPPSIRMLEGYGIARKIEALGTFTDGQNVARMEPTAEKAGGRHEARTRDLRVANAALSQLS